MASTSAQSSSSCYASSSKRQECDVFLSFRVEDSCKNFTEHLYACLKQQGIEAFRYDEELEKESPISNDILKAIEESKCSIVVISKKYASSKWCLRVLAKIIESMNTKGQIVLPVFYHVDPRYVRRQIGCFEKPFSEYEENLKQNGEEVQIWRDALTIVGNLVGWDTKNRHEPEIIKEIVHILFCQLIPDIMSNGEMLIGIRPRIYQINLLLEVGLDDKRFVGIWGMGGIGKTTIARAIYKSIAHQFDGSCFVDDVKEVSKGGFVSLQIQILSRILKKRNIEIYDDVEGAALISRKLRNKKVLLVLDDVDKLTQLEKLAGGHDWFGFGSRVIITTRDEHVLVAHGVDKRYNVEELNDGEALRFFSQNVFGEDYPKNDYISFSIQVIDYCGGLPLALQVIGSSLRGRLIIEAWEDTLKELKEASGKEIFETLKISYRGLDKMEQQIFLDIACFFRGKGKRRVIRLLNSFGFHATIGIDILVEKSLIVVSHNKVWMHDLIQEMGQEIVRRESEEPGKHSRLWLRKDVNYALSQTQGIDVIEGIVVDVGEQGESYLNANSFSVMTKLRILEINNVHISKDLTYLSDQLRVLNWHGYPLMCLPSGFQPNKLLELHLPSSHIEHLWKGTKISDKLKLINLSDSQFLLKTPDLTRFPNLESLILCGCTRLRELHKSVGALKSLVLLDLKDCKYLRNLPSHLRLESLKILILSGCSRLGKFPEIEGSMKYLTELHLDGTAIKELHSSVGNLTGLVLLNLSDCKNLSRLPSNIGSLTSLRNLILYGCSKLDCIPESLGNVTCLEKLDVSETSISCAPSSFLLLPNLEILCCRGLPREFSHSLFPAWNLLSSRTHSFGLKLVNSFSGLASIRKLDLSDCNLVDGDIPNNLHSLSSLESLNLSRNHFVSLPESLSHLNALREIFLIDCRRLQSLPKLPLNVRDVEVRDCVLLKEYYNQEKYIPSSEMGMTIIRCPISAEYQNYKVDRVKLSSMHLRTMTQRYIEVLTCQRERYCFTVPYYQLLEYFDQKRKGPSITIHCPQVLDNDDNRTGIALSAVFLIEKQENMQSEISCNFITRLETDEWPLKSPLVFDRNECELNPPFGLWVCFIPFKNLSGWLGQSCCIDISITPNTPIVKVMRCGVSMLYDQDAAKFIGRIMKGIFGSPNFYQRSILDHILNKQNHVDVSSLIDGGSRYKHSWLNALQRTLGSLPKFRSSIPPPAIQDSSTSTSNSTENDIQENDSIIMLKRNLKAVLQRTFEELKSNGHGEYYVFPQRGISSWFTHQLKRPSVTIGLPSNLHKDKKWMGLAMFAVFKVEENSKISHSFSYQVESDEYHLGRPSLLRIDQTMFDGSYQLWVFYEPRSVYPYRLNKWKHIRVSFVNYSPDVKVALCGARLLYQQNVEGFIHALIDCILGSPPGVYDFYNQTFVEGAVSLIASRKYDSDLIEQVEESDDDENSSSVSKQAIETATSSPLVVPVENSQCESHISRLRNSLQPFLETSVEDRYRTKFDFVLPRHDIPELFGRRAVGNSIKADLPPTLYTKSEWIGFAVCAVITVNKHPTAVLQNLGSVISHDLMCLFAIELGHLDPIHVHTVTEDKFLWLDARRFIWLFYTPRNVYSNILRHCTHIEAMLYTDSPDLEVQSCGLHLVCKRDREEIDRIITVH